MIYTKTRALQNLKPTSAWRWEGTDYSGLTWLDSSSTKPTEAEIDAEVERLNNGYQEKRKLEYPSVVDQLDDIYHNGIDAWKATIKVTKDKYPKP